MPARGAVRGPCSTWLFSSASVLLLAGAQASGWLGIKAWFKVAPDTSLSPSQSWVEALQAGTQGTWWRHQDLGFVWFLKDYLVGDWV